MLNDNKSPWDMKSNSSNSKPHPQASLQLTQQQQQQQRHQHDQENKEEGEQNEQTTIIKHDSDFSSFEMTEAQDRDDSGSSREESDHENVPASISVPTKETTTRSDAQVKPQSKFSPFSQKSCDSIRRSNTAGTGSGSNAGEDNNIDTNKISNGKEMNAMANISSSNAKNSTRMTSHAFESDTDAKYPIPKATIFNPSKTTSSIFSDSGSSRPRLMGVIAENAAANRGASFRPGKTTLHVSSSQVAQAVSSPEIAQTISGGHFTNSSNPPNYFLDKRIFVPHVNDVLCGRGGNINSHPGNRAFRAWVHERKSSYNLADSKAEKSRVALEVMQRVHQLNPPGRFLQKVTPDTHHDDDEGERLQESNQNEWWVEIDDVKAMAKTSQALREGAPAFRAAHGKRLLKQSQSSSQRGRTSGDMNAKNRCMSIAASKIKGNKKELSKISYGKKRKKPTSSSKPCFEKSKAKQRTTKSKVATNESKNRNESNANDSAQTYSLQETSSLPLIIDDTEYHHHSEMRALDGMISSINTHGKIGLVDNNDKTNRANQVPILHSHPLVPTEDFHASMADVAGAIPPTPPTINKQKSPLTTGLQDNTSITTPRLKSTLAIPPPVSPHESTAEKMDDKELLSPRSWDAITLLPASAPNCSMIDTEQGNVNQVHKINYSNGQDQETKKNLFVDYYRAHSLSLSDLNDGQEDLSLEVEFTNPFENEDEILVCSEEGGARQLGIISDYNKLSQQRDQQQQQYRPQQLPLQPLEDPKTVSFLLSSKEDSKLPYKLRNESSTNHPCLPSLPLTTEMAMPTRGLSFGGIGSFGSIYESTSRSNDGIGTNNSFGFKSSPTLTRNIDKGTQQSISKKQPSIEKTRKHGNGFSDAGENNVDLGSKHERKAGNDDSRNLISYPSNSRHDENRRSVSP